MYNFGQSKFSNVLWINGGALFSNVTLVEVEMENTGGFRLEVVSPSGGVLSVGDRSNTNGGWSTFNFSAGMNPPVVGGMSPYKLRFVNTAPGPRLIKQGRVSP